MLYSNSSNFRHMKNMITDKETPLFSWISNFSLLEMTDSLTSERDKNIRDKMWNF